MNKKNVKRGLLPYVFLMLLILVIYYVFNDKKYAIIDGFNYEDITNVEIEKYMKEIAKDFDWN